MKVETLDLNGNPVATLGEYEYDGDGKRVKKHVPSTGEVTVFVYDAGGKLVGEYSTIVETQSRKVSYTTADHLGSPRILTDQNGTTISRRDFMPYGEEIARSAYGSDTVRQKFTTYERDGETDLDFAQARYFACGFGRFSSPDPIYFQLSMAIDPQRFNLFQYARNSPLKWTDPTGERLHLRGDTAWIRSEILYEMAGGQEAFDQYFEIKNDEVIVREGVDLSNVNSGVKLLLDLVNSSDNYLFFAGTDGNEAASLFEGSLDDKGRRTQTGRQRANSFAGRNDTRRGGTLFGTSGRSGSNQPVSLASGDPVFFVLAVNTNAVQSQIGVSFGPSETTTVLDGLVLAIASGDEQLDGLNQVVQPVSLAIHEAAENLEFGRQIKAGGSMDYTSAHNSAIEREAIIRRELKITGGFAGGLIKQTVPKKR